MRVYTFDFMGTLEKYPVEFQDIIIGLRAGGHRCVMVTGINDQPSEKAMREHYASKFDPPLEIVYCRPDHVKYHPLPRKLEVLASLRSSMHFDNDSQICKTLGHPTALIT